MTAAHTESRAAQMGSSCGPVQQERVTGALLSPEQRTKHSSSSPVVLSLPWGVSLVGSRTFVCALSQPCKSWPGKSRTSLILKPNSLHVLSPLLADFQLGDMADLLLHLAAFLVLFSDSLILWIVHVLSSYLFFSNANLLSSPKDFLPSPCFP